MRPLGKTEEMDEGRRLVEAKERNIHEEIRKIFDER